jgi:hypothetical protein
VGTNKSASQKSRHAVARSFLPGTEGTVRDHGRDPRTFVVPWVHEPGRFSPDEVEEQYTT